MDWSKVKSRHDPVGLVEMVPDGSFITKVIKINFFTSKKGEDYLGYEFEIQETINGNDDLYGAIIKFIRNFRDNRNLNLICEDMKTLGLPITDWEKFGKAIEDPDNSGFNESVFGKEVIVTIETSSSGWKNHTLEKIIYHEKREGDSKNDIPF